MKASQPPWLTLQSMNGKRNIGRSSTPCSYSLPTMSRLCKWKRCYVYWNYKSWQRSEPAERGKVMRIRVLRRVLNTLGMRMAGASHCSCKKMWLKNRQEAA